MDYMSETANQMSYNHQQMATTYTVFFILSATKRKYLHSGSSTKILKSRTMKKPHVEHTFVIKI